MYNRVEIRNGLLKIYRLDNISAPKATGSAARYDVLHPKTKKPCKCPLSGWRFTKQTMAEHIKQNNIEFYDDETHVPQFKRFLDTVETEVMKSTFEDFTDGKKELMKLFSGDAYFDNAKPTTLTEKFISLSGGDDIILDFFSGSATTAHAVMKLNAEDGGHRKFIMVQLPEPCDEKSEAFKAGYRNICEIGKERIRRAGDMIKEENAGKEGIDDLDIGFRVFKVDESNMKEDVYYSPESYQQSTLDSYVSNIKEDRTDMDLLYSCLLDWGVMLSYPHECRIIDGFKVHTVAGNALAACFDVHISEKAVREIAEMKPLKAVFRDSCFIDSPARINVEEIFKMISPETSVKVI